ncbi:hypothetical protein I9W82_004612 [Candida metapsilosis]|uniref:HTH CENPB-type domain-containing protein n=1 Tax=Candida metapsilosis TaxID=273372 RepID=A0A8H7ZBP4_9ASCO|nr:hypothetical protein I9W82_004612 [Candida metapsilosis]
MARSKKKTPTSEEKAIAAAAEERLQQAVCYAKANPRVKLSEVAKLFNRAATTIWGRLHGAKPKTQAHEGQQFLSGKQEILFIRQLEASDAEIEGLERDEIRDLAQDVLNAFGEDRTVGINWPYKFLQRHTWIKLLPSKGATLHDMYYAVSLTVIEDFFWRYKKVVDQYKVASSNVWNIAETGVAVHKLGRTRGTDSEENGDGNGENRKVITTVVEAISAEGERMKLPIGNDKDELQTNQESADALDWAYAITYKDWITSGYFQQWIQQIFIPNTTPQDPQDYRILIMDNQATHYHEELKSILKESKVIPIYLPLHCSQLMQPLSVSVLKSTKKHYRECISTYFSDTSAEVVPRDKFIEFWCKSRNQGMSKDNILSGFEKSGLWPINKDVILNHPALANKKVLDIGVQSLSYDQLHMDEEVIEEFDLDEDDGMTSEDL